MILAVSFSVVENKNIPGQIIAASNTISSDFVLNPQGTIEEILELSIKIA